MWPEFCLLAASPLRGTTVAGTGSVGEGVSPALDAPGRIARRQRAILAGSVVPSFGRIVASELDERGCHASVTRRFRACKSLEPQTPLH